MFAVIQSRRGFESSGVSAEFAGTIKCDRHKLNQENHLQTDLHSSAEGTGLVVAISVSALMTTIYGHKYFSQQGLNRTVKYQEVSRSIRLIGTVCQTINS